MQILQLFLHFKIFKINMLTQRARCNSLITIIIVIMMVVMMMMVIGNYSL